MNAICKRLWNEYECLIKTAFMKISIHINSYAKIIMHKIVKATLLISSLSFVNYITLRKWAVTNERTAKAA